MNTRRIVLFVCTCLVLLILAQPLGSSGSAALDAARPVNPTGNPQPAGNTQPQPPKIRLQYATFDPLAGEPRVPPELQSQVSPAAGGLYLVQFEGPVQAEWKRALEAAGARLLAYIPDYAFICSLEGARPENLRALAHVRWVGVYEPAYRLAESLRDPALLKQERALSLVVLLAPGADVAVINTQVAGMGGELVQPQAADAETGFSQPQRLELPAAELDELAALDDVLWVEPYASPVILNDIAGGEILKANTVRDRIGLYGNGQIVGVADTGLDTGSTEAEMSDDFEGRIEAGQALCAPYGLRNEWSDLHGHGTHTTGSILGNGAYSGSNPAASQYRGSYAGVAPEARVVFQSIDSDGDGSLECVPGNLVEELFGPAYALGARIHSNSWGAGVASASELSGGYSTMTQAIDQAAWTYPDLLIVFSAGNSGTDADSNGVIDLGSLLSTGSAKNHISVGASENDRPEVTYTWQVGMGYWSDPIAQDGMADHPNGMAAFSSRGPTDDGRIKPDVVAPGTFVISARSHMPQAGTGWGLVGEHYYYHTGTSMAAPLVSGAAAVVREWLIKLAGVSNPSAALVKALLLNGAVDPSPGQYGNGAFQEVPFQQPNPVSGWGRVDLESTLIPQGLRQAWLRDDAVGLATGEYVSYQVELGKFLAEEPGNASAQVETGGPFRLTLVWTDFPGTPGAARFLVNDLDLEVIAPDGTQLSGNAGLYPSEPCLRGGRWDACNNVETVLIPQAQNGVYTIRVYGANVPYGPQKFALAGYGDCVNTACQPLDQFLYLPSLSAGR